MTLTPASSAARTSEVATLEPFADRIGRLFDELKLAVQYDRPSILLAVYSSEFIRADAEAALTAKLRDLGQTVVHYRVTGEADADIPLHLSERSDHATTVYFIFGLQWGGGRDGALAYRALNIRREYFVDYRMRAVFWLTEKEAKELPFQAPDFWAFRHRTVEFMEAPSQERVVLLAQEFAWRDLENQVLREGIDAKIEFRLGLLKDLPITKESMASRAELLRTLAMLYWAKGKQETAVNYWQQAIQIYQALYDVQRESWCYNGLGNAYRALNQLDDAFAAYQRAMTLTPDDNTIYNGLGNLYATIGWTEDAISAYQHAIRLDPKYALPYSNLGNVYARQGRYTEAIVAYQRAIELNPNHDAAYHNLATVYAQQGRTQDAINYYKRVIELNPSSADAHTGLGNVYRTLGRIEEAITAYLDARQLAPESAFPDYNLASLEATRQNRASALSYLEEAIRHDSRLGREARHDPDFDFIRDDPRFGALIGEARDEQNSPSETVAQ